MVDWWYYNNLFGVEDGLFYENNKRLGYYQDEKEDEIIKNNHKATVDRMLELKELNNELKRIHRKLKKESNHLKDDFQYYMNKSGTLETELLRLRKENEQLKDEIDELKQKEEVLNRIWRSYLENDE